MHQSTLFPDVGHKTESPDLPVVVKVLDGVEDKSEIDALRKIYPPQVLREASRQISSDSWARLRLWVEERNQESEENSEGEYILVADAQAFQAAVEDLRSATKLGIDTETTALSPREGSVRLLQLSDGLSPVVVFDFFSLKAAGVDFGPLKDLLGSGIEKIAHNIAFEIAFLESEGLPLAPPYFDVMLASILVRAGLDGDNAYRQSSLKSVAKRELDYTLDKQAQTSNWAGILTPTQLEYAALDALIMHPLARIMRQQLKEANLLEVATDEFLTARVVAHMQSSGMKLDIALWNTLKSEVQKRRDECGTALRGELARQGNLLLSDGQSINLNSQKELLPLLNTMGIDATSTARGTISPYAVDFPVVGQLIEYRKYEKLYSSFAEPLLGFVDENTGRIHPSFFQMGAVSGRFSCRSPNLQQIPRSKEFRQCFVAEEGNVLVVADFSQIELRVMAEMCGDEAMIRAYQEGRDLHRLTAHLITRAPLDRVTPQDRQIGKALNFGLIYGMSARSFRGYAMINYGVSMSYNDAKRFRERFFNAYPQLRAHHERVQARLKQRKRFDEMETRTLSGRRRVWRDRPTFHELLNIPVQGTSADITKRAMILIYPDLREISGRMVAQVHDEIVVEVPERFADDARALLERRMVEAGKAFLKKVPIEVSVGVGRSWAEK